MKLVLEWSDWFYENTDTFRGALGTQLAYLWPAILRNRQIEVATSSAIVRLLKREKVSEDSPIWDYIDVKNTR